MEIVLILAVRGFYIACKARSSNSGKREKVSSTGCLANIIPVYLTIPDELCLTRRNLRGRKCALPAPNSYGLNPRLLLLFGMQWGKPCTSLQTAKPSCPKVRALSQRKAREARLSKPKFSTE